MTRLEFCQRITYPSKDAEHDIDLIMSAFASHGYEVYFIDAYRAWVKHSEETGLSWAPIPKDDHEVVRSAIKYLREC